MDTHILTRKGRKTNEIEYKTRQNGKQPKRRPCRRRIDVYISELSIKRPPLVNRAAENRNQWREMVECAIDAYGK